MEQKNPEEVQPKEQGTQPQEQQEEQELEMVPATIALGALEKAKREIESNMVVLNVKQDKED